jgi:hypothetical protein
MRLRSDNATVRITDVVKVEKANVGFSLAPLRRVESDVVGV